jgi:hypothetical protein
VKSVTSLELGLAPKQAQMPPISDLTGRWIGHYLQRGQQHPITADLVQTADSLSGSMCDGQPDAECSLFDFAAAAGLPPGADEQIEAGLRKSVPEARAARIQYVWRLPADSVLQGRRAGKAVSFVKTYKGASFSGFKLGEKLLGAEQPAHPVHYEGELSHDGTVLEGRWWIEGDTTAPGKHRTEGEFMLRRQSRNPQE